MRARVAFLGSPEFAVPSLRRLHAEHDVRLVVTQPDRPAGRGRRLEPTPVRREAADLGLECTTFERGRRTEVEEELAAARVEALVVVAFGHILKPSTLQRARCGAVNVHASLLPRWRGVAPIEHALLAGDAWTGTTLMHIDAGVDTGPILAQRMLPIEPDDTRLTLAAKLAAQGAQLLGEHLAAFLAGALPGRAQAEEGACYAPRLEKSAGRIDWRGDPVAIANRVRGLYAWPGAFTELDGAILKVHVVRPLDRLPPAAPGRIVFAHARRGVHVACGGGTLELVEVQLAGRSRCAARDLVAGRVLAAGRSLQ